MFQNRKRRPLLAAAALAALPLTLAAPVAALDVIPLLPDACTSSLTPGTVTIDDLGGGVIRVFSTPGSLAGKQVVLLINGNGFFSGYDNLASHLARNGFITAVFIRPGNAASVPAVFDAIDDVLADLAIAKNDPALDIALVGHSVGGRLAIDAAKADTDDALGYPIRVVATLAPVASTASVLDGWNISGFLSLYGSQDEDTDAYDGTVNEAFFAYDFTGTENSTTCNVPPCVAPSPGFQKTMVFAYGADHAGLIGVGNSGAFEPQNLDYLTPADTLCITKAYVTGFLRYHLYGDVVYKGMLRGEWKAPSVSAIDTAEADGFGNPAGAPLRLFVQTSPIQHKTIQNFAAGLGTYTKSGVNVAVQHADAGDFDGTPQSVRHNTESALVGWDADLASQWVRFAIPAGSRDGSNFTHFSLRIGQLNGSPPPYDNPVNANQNIWVGLEDVNGAMSWHQLNNIPAPDRYTAAGPIRAQSHMATRRISLSLIDDDINEADVRAVRFFFNPGSHGTVMIDSLEWHRD
jgi:acetyl esterase/lipase